MKLTQLSQYHTQPGLITEWTMHPKTMTAAAEAAEDHRPPSYLQEAHVRTAALQHNAGISAPTWLATAFDIANPLDLDTFESTCLDWIGRHETLRSGFRQQGDQLRRFTLAPEAILLERTVIGDFSDADELQRYLEDRFDAATNPLTWPPYLFLTVTRERSATVYLAFDHSNVDGYSIALMAHEIQELYAAAIAGREARLVQVGSYLDFSAIERDSALRVDGDHEAVRRWRDFVAASGGVLPPFPLDLGLVPGELPKQTGVCEWLLDSTAAEAFAAACKSGDGSFFAGVLAAAGLAAYELGDSSVYRSVLPLHTRTEVQWQASLGWYIGLAPIEVPMPTMGDFRDVMRLTRRAVRVARPVAEVPFARVCEVLGAILLPRFVISYIDGRFVPGADCWRQWNAHAFGKVSYGDEVYMWINRALDEVYVTIRYPSTNLAHQNMSRYIDRIRGILNTVARTGNYSMPGTAAVKPEPA